MRVLWYWPHPHERLNPAAEPLLDRGDDLTIQCLVTFRGHEDDPRVDFRRELPEVRPLRGLPLPLRRVLRTETYVRRALARERLVRGECFDVCHVMMPNYLVDAVALPRLRRIVPVVLSVHDVVPHEARLPQALERHLLERVYRSADVLVVFHEVVADELVGEFGVARSQIVVAEFPIRPARDVVPTTGTEVREGPTRFLFFGTLRADKGVPVLLEAARRLAGDPTCAIHVAGGGDPALERAVAAAAARGDVTAEVGWVSTERQDQLLRAADVMVLPYSDPLRFRSQSGVLADAYAYRTPVLASDVGAVGPTVRADGSGWVVPPGDVDALVERVQAVAADATARREARAAIEAALPKHSYERCARTLQRAYELAVGSRLSSA